MGTLQRKRDGIRVGNIQAATTDDVFRSSKDWVFVDLRFASKKKTCGLLVGDGTPQTLSFADDLYVTLF